MKLIALLLEFLREEEGQDRIEYALLLGSISLVGVVALTAAGSQGSGVFENVKDGLTTAAANT